MKNYLVLLILTTFFCSCETELHKNHSDWSTLTLPNGWRIQTPRNFKETILHGIDSEPGIIYSITDSILLEFDTGNPLKNESCDLKKNLEKAQKSIESGFVKNSFKVPTLHKAYIDTIDGNIATIVTPVDCNTGTVYFYISDCESGVWLGMHGQKLTKEKEKIVLEIFRTIYLKKK